MIILLVEDHLDTQRAMATLLRLTGHTVTVAGTIAEALAAIAKQSFDCAVIDLGLPDGDGTDLMRSVRDRMPLKAIALTGSTGPSDIALCYESGFLFHLPKPVTIEDLEAAIARL